MGGITTARWSTNGNNHPIHPLVFARAGHSAGGRLLKLPSSSIGRHSGSPEREEIQRHAHDNEGVITGRLRRSTAGILISAVDTSERLYDQTVAWLILRGEDESSDCPAGVSMIKRLPG